MNELTLSSDLNQIELEINYHKQIAGQSIWEIGRRLNHVKENDLVHGEFKNWLDDIGVSYPEANRMMKVANNLSNVSTLKDLGSTTLYLIATLPEDQKQKEIAKAEQGDPSTVRELQELKRQNKLQSEQLKQKDETIEQLTNREPEVREIEIEKIPDDYHSLKGNFEATKKNYEYYKQQNNELRDEIKQLEESYRGLLQKRSEVDEKSVKYEQLSQAINQAEGRLNATQKLVSDYKHLSDLLKKSNEFLAQAGSLVYMDLSEVISRDNLAKQELNFLIERLDKFLSDLSSINKNTIIEGEIIND
ncbi:DUF3102 domain-containing protein [Vagococcus vulneris]|uniref:DUF3102 domain-containing protein n=1 Tax=Vagococcus vulneris TaxID=1977869 RepID=A0A429ZQM2_9ENTE|nr:DUF3102 domain-containing protein [Vagococcus vulneris]RST96024.1 hypothetical protein CBF37_11305 [Vagococcus vulneris]